MNIRNSMKPKRREGAYLEGGGAGRSGAEGEGKIKIRGANTEVQTNTEARRPTRGKGGGAKSGGQRMFRCVALRGY